MYLLDRQWLYQTCTELGLFQSSNSNWQIFGHEFDMEFFQKQCKDSFGPKYVYLFCTSSIFSKCIIIFIDRFSPINSVEQIVNYGGLTPNTTNVLCVEGSLDPWRMVGLTQNLTTGVEALLINGLTKRV